jgi:hypothetical protein
MSNVVYVSNSHIERREGPLRIAQLPGSRRWQLGEENRRVFAEHLLNNKPQLSAFRATEGFVTLTKQTKMGLCEQVRVN